MLIEEGHPSHPLGADSRPAPVLANVQYSKVYATLLLHPHIGETALGGEVGRSLMRQGRRPTEGWWRELLARVSMVTCES